MASIDEVKGFTPGPWRVEQDTTLVWGKCVSDDTSTYGMGYPVAEAKILLGRYPRAARHDEAEANAKLISLAPTMYSEIARLRKALEEVVLHVTEAVRASDIPDCGDIVLFEMEQIEVIAREALTSTLLEGEKT